MSVEMKFAQLKFVTIKELKADVKSMLEVNSSFEVVDINDMSEAVSVLEKTIEECGLRCRTYTSKRSAVTAAVAAGGVAGTVGASTVGVVFIPVVGVSLAPILGLAGISTAIGIGLHRLATRNPDYEIIKHPLSKKIVVEYKKG